MRLEEHFSKFGNHEVMKEKIKQQLLEFNSNVGFSLYKNPRHCGKMQMPSKSVSFLVLELKLRKENDKSICMKKIKSIVLETKWFLLKNLCRKFHFIFEWFVTVAFIVDSDITYRRKGPLLDE